jgi:hypothetical protein
MPQTVPAAANLLRYVLHDWPDDYCNRILRALMPTMATGIGLVVQGYVLPEPGSVGRL